MYITDTQKKQLIKHMRTITGLGILTCRKLLKECSWDLDKAIEKSKEHIFCI